MEVQWINSEGGRDTTTPLVRVAELLS